MPPNSVWMPNQPHATIARISDGRSAKCCNAAYLYALYGAIHDLDWRDLPEAKKAEFKALAAELRESGRFR